MSLPHGASVFLHHPPTQRVLLQHRTDDAPSYPGHWGMFGGSGEPEDDGDPVRTLRREIHEELGLELEPEKIAALWDYMTGRGSHRYVFLYPWDDPDYPFTQTEGQGRGWFTPAEALESLTLTDNSRRDLTLLAERLAPPLPRQECRPCGPRISCSARHRSRCRGEARRAGPRGRGDSRHAAEGAGG